MRSFVERVRTATKYTLLAVAGGGVLCGIALGPIVNAESASNKVNITISGSPAPNLQVGKISSTSGHSSVTITARVDNLTQVQIYVDGIYSTTVPLTVHDTFFSYDLILSEGIHTVKLVGISAYTSTYPEIEMTVEHRAPTTPGVIDEDGEEKPDTPKSQISSRTQGGGIVVGESPEGVETSKQPVIKLPKWAMDVLLTFDVVDPGRTSDTPRMIWRLTLITIGLFIVILARPALAIYRYIRYKVFGWHKRPLPLFLRKRPLFWLRVFGILLVLIVFMYI